MHTITIISGTNRPDSNTEKVANYYLSVLQQKVIQVDLFSLKNLPYRYEYISENIILSAEHGPRGGDEINKIIFFYFFLY